MMWNGDGQTILYLIWRMIFDGIAVQAKLASTQVNPLYHHPTTTSNKSNIQSKLESQQYSTSAKERHTTLEYVVAP